MKLSVALSQVRELELELAQTKLALVEAECRNQVGFVFKILFSPFFYFIPEDYSFVSILRVGLNASAECRSV